MQGHQKDKQPGRATPSNDQYLGAKGEKKDVHVPQSPKQLQIPCDHPRSPSGP